MKASISGYCPMSTRTSPVSVISEIDEGRYRVKRWAWRVGSGVDGNAGGGGGALGELAGLDLGAHALAALGAVGHSGPGGMRPEAAVADIGEGGGLRIPLGLGGADAVEIELGHGC